MYDDLLGINEEELVEEVEEEEVAIISQPITPKQDITLAEIARLSKFLLDEFPGEIQGSAVDTAIRLLKYYKQL